MNVQDNLAQCEAMIAKGSTSFYHAFRLLDSPRREAVFVIYAFCRLIDDAIDEEQPLFSIDELEQGFKDLEHAEGHFIWDSLRWLFRHFKLSKEPFFRQMEGQRRDLVVTHYETMEQLESYCYLVAGTVGEMLLPVLHDAPGEAVTKSGIYLGKAMQIVNIIRDVGEDRERGRRYLPLELMKRHGYTEEQFDRGEVNEAFRHLVDELMELSRSWFRIGMENIGSYPVQSAIAVELAAGYYSAILNKVKDNRYEVFTKRSIVGSLEKGVIYASVKRKYGKPRQNGTETAVS